MVLHPCGRVCRRLFLKPPHLWMWGFFCGVYFCHEWHEYFLLLFVDSWLISSEGNLEIFAGLETAWEMSMILILNEILEIGEELFELIHVSIQKFKHFRPMFSVVDVNSFPLNINSCHCFSRGEQVIFFQKGLR